MSCCPQTRSARLYCAHTFSTPCETRPQPSLDPAAHLRWSRHERVHERQRAHRLVPHFVHSNDTLSLYTHARSPSSPNTLVRARARVHGASEAARRCTGWRWLRRRVTFVCESSSRATTTPESEPAFLVLGLWHGCGLIRMHNQRLGHRVAMREVATAFRTIYLLRLTFIVFSLAPHVLLVLRSGRSGPRFWGIDRVDKRKTLY
ncbi:hypothetical protein EDB89DRAFT_1589276 [Lactarius sanguifluus]|nr:hypothetical protein EDB89DRAFT_1589276 [Lactarius sanguifluus]